MGQREVCAACGLPRATRDDLAALAPECREHVACSRCETVRLCWHVRADHCAETRGGWKAIATAARAEAERLRTAAADERADVVAWMRRQGWSRASYDIRDGAHVGAAKGGDHG